MVVRFSRFVVQLLVSLRPACLNISCRVIFIWWASLFCTLIFRSVCVAVHLFSHIFFEMMMILLLHRHALMSFTHATRDLWPASVTKHDRWRTLVPVQLSPSTALRFASVTDRTLHWCHAGICVQTAIFSVIVMRCPMKTGARRSIPNVSLLPRIFTGSYFSRIPRWPTTSHTHILVQGISHLSLFSGDLWEHPHSPDYSSSTFSFSAAIKTKSSTVVGTSAVSRVFFHSSTFSHLRHQTSITLGQARGSVVRIDMFLGFSESSIYSFTRGGVRVTPKPRPILRSPAVTNAANTATPLIRVTSQDLALVVEEEVTPVNKGKTIFTV